MKPKIYLFNVQEEFNEYSLLDRIKEVNSNSKIETIFYNSEYYSSLISNFCSNNEIEYKSCDLDDIGAYSFNIANHIFQKSNGKKNVGAIFEKKKREKIENILRRNQFIELNSIERIE